jgi:hypothetical protein
MTRRTPRGAAAACLTALVAAAGCGSPAPVPPAGTTVAMPAIPLDTSLATTAGTWATVVMGGSAAQHNNFWQLFIRPSGSARWKLVTPPGTADNGGLVLAGGTTQALVTAFRPSQDLRYTPLTQTSDAGHVWSALSPLDAALASTPDSLAVQPATGRLLALLGTGTAEQGTPRGTGWTTLITAHAIAATQAGKSCGLRALTAVAYSPAGTPLLAGPCSRPGVVGIFAPAGGAWQNAGPELAGPLAKQAITVLRLSTVGNQTAALLAAGTGQHATLLAAWSGARGTRWTISPKLTTSSHAVTATSLGPGQTAAAITGTDQGAMLARGHWQLLPALPPATVALATGNDGTTDALAVHRSTLTVWQLATRKGSWAREQTISVPIQYGSSG